jgi:hypothetical protein
MSLKDKFLAYDSINTKLDEIKAVMDAALKERSSIVEQIALEISPKKKVLRAGKELTVVARNGHYFFRGGKSDDSVVSIED